MPWITPIPESEMSAEELAELRVRRERAAICQTIPRGWVSRHIRLTYDVSPDSTGPHTPWGICEHGHVCLGATDWPTWRHPFPVHPRSCDKPPATGHLGIAAEMS